MEEKAKEKTAKEGKGNNLKYLAIVGIIVIIVVAVAAYGSQNYSKSTEAPVKEKMTSSQAKPLYKDGTYSAEGVYTTHVGEKHIKVTVTLKNDIITDSTVLNEADDPTSVRFQDSFIGGYKEFVTGKNISSVHLSKIARSSLTPEGFNKALKLIEEQAKS